MPLLCEFKHPIKPVEYEKFLLVCQDFFTIRVPSNPLLITNIRCEKTHKKDKNKIHQIVMLNRVAISSSICALHCNEIIYYDCKLPFYYPNLLSVLLRTATALHTVLLCTLSEKMNSLRSRGHCCQQKTNIKP